MPPAARLYLAPARGPFVRRNLLDLAIIALPMLRPLRLGDVPLEATGRTGLSSPREE